MKLIIVNGPNLNLQGRREPELYGSQSFEDYLVELRKRYPQHTIDYQQSNIEGELIDIIQQSGYAYDGLIINLGGYSHTSVALHDALLAQPAPVVEVHISNIFAREEYRHHSLVTTACRGMICGLGLDGYRLAVESFC